MNRATNRPANRPASALDPNRSLHPRNSKLFLGCKDCEKRHPGCHDHCETYHAAKAQVEANKRARSDALAGILAVHQFHTQMGLHPNGDKHKRDYIRMYSRYSQT